MARTDTLTRLGLIVSTGLVLGASLVGCASYANAPGPRSTPAVEDPNRRNPAAVMTEALRVIQARYPVPGEFAVQFPMGTTSETASKALLAMGSGAQRAGAGTAGLPTYHVGRVWIRAGDAKVDILRPVVELEGSSQHRPYTVWMEGGLTPWKTMRVQTWAIGSMPLPVAGEDVPRRTAGSNAVRAGNPGAYDAPAASTPPQRAPAPTTAPTDVPDDEMNSEMVEELEARPAEPSRERSSDVRVYTP